MRNRKGSKKSQRAGKKRGGPPALVGGAGRPVLATASPAEAVVSATDGVMSSPGKGEHDARAAGGGGGSPQSSRVITPRSSALELLGVLHSTSPSKKTDDGAEDQNVTHSRHVYFEEPVVPHEARLPRTQARNILRGARQAAQMRDPTFTYIVHHAMALHSQLQLSLVQGQAASARLHDDTVHTLVSAANSGLPYAPLRLTYGLTLELHSRLLLAAVNNSPDMHTRMYSAALRALTTVSELRARGGMLFAPLWLVPGWMFTFAARLLRREENAAHDKWLGSYAIPFRSTLGPHAPMRRHVLRIQRNFAIPRFPRLEDRLIMTLEHAIIYTHVLLSIITGIVLALLP